MEFLPALQLGILNGWILFVINGVVEGLLIVFQPKKVRKRLIDRSTFTKKQKILTTISKFFSAIVIILIFLSPLVIGWEFYLGLTLFILGEIGLIIAIQNFATTPLNEPVTTGIYKISRNPQQFSLWIMILGIILTIGSGILLVVYMLSIGFGHFSMLAEEEACLQQYGEPYKEYMKRVPRYFLFF